MKGIKSFYNGAFFTVLTVILAGAIMFGLHNFKINHQNLNFGVEDTEFGSFLAAQHALYVNDFDAASKMLDNVKSNDASVAQAKTLVGFLSGKMPTDVKVLKSDKDLANKLIYDAYLLNQDKWSELYKRHTKDNSVMTAPMRVFSAVKQGKTKEALKFIDSLKTTDNWKSFMRGQVAVLNNDIDKALKEFADVHPDFMNINDYLYLMSFYKHNEMYEDMDILRNDFTAKPAGMYVLNYDDVPDWSEYDGYKNNIAFSMVQTVSHTQVMIFTDLSLMLLRFADAISNSNQDVLNYYLGLYYFYNFGDYEKAFSSISKTSPLYLFGQMKIAEKTGNLNKIEELAHKNPLFIPAGKIMLANYVRDGKKRAALNLINSALKHKDLSDLGRVYFLKQRANVYLMFDEPKKAQKDIYDLMDIDNRLLSDVMLLQARTWNQRNVNLADAYNYTMNLIKRNTSDVVAWDLLGVIVDKKEGVDAALELMERVSEVSVNVSSLYEHLGDLYKKKGDIDKAKKSYLRAIDLSDDGMVILPNIKKKLRNLK